MLVAGAVHVFVAPYSKVEESFSLHAIHDILALGIAPSQLNSVSLDSLRSSSGPS